MQQANLSAFERSRFHSWQHRLVDWKWQYMARMWSRFSPGALILLERLDIAEIRKPISERDGRVTAFDPQALAVSTGPVCGKYVRAKELNKSPPPHPQRHVRRLEHLIRGAEVRCFCVGKGRTAQ